MAVLTVDDLIASLQHFQLLDPEQLRQLSAIHCADARSLAKELIQRGWLTPYQVNHLFQDKGRDLVLGHYVLLERLGEGGMGQVFKARHRRLDRVVALKLIRKECLANEETVRRFRREIRAVAQLSHPHIVVAFDADEADGVHYYAMEYVDGTDLGRQVVDHGPLQVRQACVYIRQAALALQHASEKELVHRDIKPSNLLLTARGDTIKLLDLGLARLRPAADDSSNSSLTQVGAIVGTPDFMAPEQATSSHDVDIRADIYGLGCTLYYLLIGQPPYAGLAPLEKLFHHRYHPAVPAESLRREIGPAVAELLRKLMAKKPEDRYQTPAELVAALDVLLEKSEEFTATAPETAAPSAPTRVAAFDITPSVMHPSRMEPRRLKRSAERRRWLWINLTAAAVLIGALILFLLLLGHSDPRRTEAERHTDPAGAELRALQARAVDPVVDRDKLRQDLLAFRRAHFGEASALDAAELLRRLPSPLDALSPVTQPPGAGWDGPVSDLVATLGDGRQRHWGPATCVALSPDGKLLASGGDDDVIRLWDPATMREQSVLRGHTAPVRSIAFSPDGKRLLSSSFGGDRSVRLWDVASGKQLLKLGGTPVGGQVSGVFLAGGKQLLCGGYKSLGIYDAETGKPLRQFPELAHWVMHLAVAADGRHALLALNTERFGRLYDLEAGKEICHLDGHKYELNCVALSPDGHHALTGAADGLARMWELATGKELYHLPHKGVVHGTFLADGKLILTGGEGKTLFLWETATGKRVRAFEGHEGAIRALVATADGKIAYSAGDDTTVRRWNLATGKEIEPVEAPAGSLINVVFAADGRQLVGGRQGRRPWAWDFLTEKKPRPFVDETVGLHRLALAPDGVLALTVGDQRAVPVWDVAGGKTVRFLEGHTDWVRAAAFAPDGLLAVTSSRNLTGNLRLWDVAGGKEVRQLIGHSRSVTSATFTPDGRQILSGSDDGSLRLWDTNTGKDLRDFGSLAGSVRGLAFLPDGRRFFLAGGDALLRRWTLGPETAEVRFEGHKQEVAFVAVALDGQSVASATEGGDVIVWEANTSGKKLHRWQLPGPIAGIAFAPDSRHLATANGNGTVCILRLASPH